MDNDTYRIDVSFKKIYSTKFESEVSADYLAQAVLSALSKHKGAGISKTSEAIFLGQACMEFDPSISFETSLLLAEYYKCKFFVNEFEIEYEDDIYFLLENLNDENIKYLEFEELNFNEHRAFSYKANDPAWEFVKKYVGEQKFSERARAVKNILFQHLVKIEDQFFFKQAADKMLMDMKKLYDSEQEEKKKILTRKVEAIIRTCQ